jgi:mono/diheme cytochrome c family protein
MNYPVWDVFFGSGFLIALVSIVHVFVSHFAVGAGLFLVISEKKGYREEDTPFLGWLQRHSRFFVLLTVVFGAVTGVGIWFTISLVHPAATSTLIRSYVWAWAIEWLFFFIEITAAIMYVYGWSWMDRRTHLWFGWVYFWSALGSMVVINGILTFMLTPGGWLQSGSFWEGLLNPTYWPSLGLRFSLAIALAGIYAMVTGNYGKDRELRRRVVGWSARWTMPAFLALPIFAFWYISMLPEGVWASTQGRMPTATLYARMIIVFSALAFLGSLWALLRPGRFPLAASLSVFVAAFLAVWSFEFIRESIRKPYVIYGYMYSNSILAEARIRDGDFNLEALQRGGILKSSRWTRHREVEPHNEVEAGSEIFRLECQSCHTLGRYRGISKLLKTKSWDEAAIYARLGTLHSMVNGAMPPFVGTEQEKAALARFLAQLNAPTVAGSAGPGSIPRSGETVFNSSCSDCHLESPDDVLFSRLGRLDEMEVYQLIGTLEDLNPLMPAFAGPDEERMILARWISGRWR